MPLDGNMNSNVEDVLAGRRHYDELTAPEQEIVRTEWTTRMDARRQNLNFAVSFEAERRSYAELDADGQVVVRTF